MFLSTSHNKIDKKGRVSVPRNFRTYLDLEGGSLILFKSLQFNCIEGTTLKRISQYVEAIDEIDTMSKDASILRMMMADSFEIKYDNEGRINIPESLLSYADIDDIAVFAGIGKSFMIWSDIEYKKEIQKNEFHKNTNDLMETSNTTLYNQKNENSLNDENFDDENDGPTLVFDDFDQSADLDVPAYIRKQNR